MHDDKKIVFALKFSDLKPRDL